MTVEPFTKNGGLVIFVTVGDRHQPRVRGESVVFGGGLHDPLLNSLVFPNWRNISITLIDPEEAAKRTSLRNVVRSLRGPHTACATGRVGKLLDDFSQRCQKRLHTLVQRKASFRQKRESSVALQSRGICL
jgi:hypothetical protein